MHHAVAYGIEQTHSIIIIIIIIIIHFNSGNKAHKSTKENKRTQHTTQEDSETQNTDKLYSRLRALHFTHRQLTQVQVTTAIP